MRIRTTLTFGLLCATLSTPVFALDLSITVAGDPPGLTDILRNASLVATLKADGTTDPQSYIAAARADYRRLLTGLYAEGYYGGQISITIDGREAAGLAPLDTIPTISTIAVTVQPGPLFTFGNVSVAPVPPNTKLPDEFATGQTARSDTIRTATNAGIAAWQQEGHAKASVAGQQITARHPGDTLDAAVTLSPGPQLTFGPLGVSGNVRVRTDRIVDIAGLPTGQVYDPDDVTRAAARLRRTGAFRSVAMVEADQIGPGNTLPFEVQLVEEKPRRIGFGIELSSIDGLSVSTYWIHRNLLGGAERLRVDANVAGIGGTTGGMDYTLSAAFNRPRTFSIDTDLFVNATLEQLDEPGYLLKQATVEAGLTRLIGEDIKLSGALSLSRAHVEDASGIRDYTLLSVPITGEMDKRDDPLDSHSGYYINLELTPFIGVGDIDSGGRIFAEARGYRSIGDRFTLAARGQVGSVIGADILRAPADYLFYSGGTATVRGQPYQGLGISLSRDIGGSIKTFDIGGASFAGAQLEARVKVTKSIGVVGFYDVGYVGASATPLTDGDWQAGAGFGLRYQTGIGPIRLDVATPATGDGAGKSVQIYIGIGQSF